MLAEQTGKRSKPTLNLAQADFSAGLLAAENPVPLDVVGPTKDKKALKRFGVYRNNVLVSLTEALMSAFPTILQLVGDEFFRAMAKIYISENPPQSAMLVSHGRQFGAFLDIFEPVQSLPYLGDVARLEYAWLQAYNAADVPPLNPAKLQDVAPENLPHVTFQFHPASQLLSCNHAAYSIWAAHKQENPTAAMSALVDRPEDILITRPVWDVMVISLPAGGHAFIKALKAGATLGEAAEQAAIKHPDFDFAQNLGGLLETGALTALQLQSTNQS